eukprot:SAG11_NODE_12937_length_678_cov_0.922280_1_plen_156_part_01
MHSAGLQRAERLFSLLQHLEPRRAALALCLFIAAVVSLLVLALFYLRGHTTLKSDDKTMTEASPERSDDAGGTEIRDTTWLERRVFLGRIPYQMNKIQLIQGLKQHGRVVDLCLGRGFAFASFESTNSAKSTAAVLELELEGGIIITVAHIAPSPP